MKLFLFLALFSLASAQTITLPDDDGFASRFHVKIHRHPQSATSFLTSGVLINGRHALTIASGVHGVTVAELRIHFGHTRLTGSDMVGVEQIFVHPNYDNSQPLENNMAVLRIPLADSLRTSTAFFQHRQLGALISNHFCTMLGFGMLPAGQNLNMVPAQALDSRECNHLFDGSFFCTRGTPGQFAQCGGFIGAPIICDGERLAGLVTQEQFCGANPHAYILNLEQHHEWIQRVSSATTKMVSLVALVIGLALGKML